MQLHLEMDEGDMASSKHFVVIRCRWLVQKTQDQLREALIANPGYVLKIIGHSLGGGTAAIATMM